MDLYHPRGTSRKIRCSRKWWTQVVFHHKGDSKLVHTTPEESSSKASRPLCQNHSRSTNNNVWHSLRIGHLWQGLSYPPQQRSTRAMQSDWLSPRPTRLENSLIRTNFSHQSRGTSKHQVASKYFASITILRKAAASSRGLTMRIGTRTSIRRVLQNMPHSFTSTAWTLKSRHSLSPTIWIIRRTLIRRWEKS